MFFDTLCIAFLTLVFSHVTCPSGRLQSHPEDGPSPPSSDTCVSTIMAREGTRLSPRQSSGSRSLLAPIQNGQWETPAPLHHPMCTCSRIRNCGSSCSYTAETTAHHPQHPPHPPHPLEPPRTKIHRIRADEQTLTRTCMPMAQPDGFTAKSGVTGSTEEGLTRTGTTAQPDGLTAKSGVTRHAQERLSTVSLPVPTWRNSNQTLPSAAHETYYSYSVLIYPYHQPRCPDLHAPALHALPPYHVPGRTGQASGLPDRQLDMMAQLLDITNRHTTVVSYTACRRPMAYLQVEPRQCREEGRIDCCSGRRSLLQNNAARLASVLVVGCLVSKQRPRYGCQIFPPRLHSHHHNRSVPSSSSTFPEALACGTFWSPSPATGSPPVPPSSTEQALRRAHQPLERVMAAHALETPVHGIGSSVSWIREQFDGDCDCCVAGPPSARAPTFEISRAAQRPLYPPRLNVRNATNPDVLEPRPPGTDLGGHWRCGFAKENDDSTDAQPYPPDRPGKLHRAECTGTNRPSPTIVEPPVTHRFPVLTTLTLWPFHSPVQSHRYLLPIILEPWRALSSGLLSLYPHSHALPLPFLTARPTQSPGDSGLYTHRHPLPITLTPPSATLRRTLPPRQRTPTGPPPLPTPRSEDRCNGNPQLNSFFPLALQISTAHSAPCPQPATGEPVGLAILFCPLFSRCEDNHFNSDQTLRWRQHHGYLLHITLSPLPSRPTSTTCPVVAQCCILPDCTLTMHEDYSTSAAYPSLGPWHSPAETVTMLVREPYPYRNTAALETTPSPATAALRRIHARCPAPLSGLSESDLRLRATDNYILARLSQSKLTTTATGSSMASPLPNPASNMTSPPSSAPPSPSTPTPESNAPPTVAELALLDGADYSASRAILDGDDDLGLPSGNNNLRADMELYLFDVSYPTSAAALDAVRTALHETINTGSAEEFPWLFDQDMDDEQSDTDVATLDPSDSRYLDPEHFFCTGGQPGKGGPSFVDPHVRIRVAENGKPHITIRMLDDLRRRLCHRGWQAYWSAGPNTWKLATLTCTISSAVPAGGRVSPVTYQTELQEAVTQFFLDAQVEDPNVWGSLANPPPGAKPSLQAQVASPAVVSMALEYQDRNPIKLSAGGHDWLVTLAPTMAVLPSPGPATAAVPGVADWEDSQLANLGLFIARAAHKAKPSLKGLPIFSRRSPNTDRWFTITFDDHDTLEWAIDHPEILPGDLQCVVHLLQANASNANPRTFLAPPSQLNRDRAQARANADTSKSFEHLQRQQHNLQTAFCTVAAYVPTMVSTFSSSVSGIMHRQVASAERADKLSACDNQLNSVRSQLIELRHALSTQRLILSINGHSMTPDAKEEARISIEELTRGITKLEDKETTLEARRTEIEAIPLPPLEWKEPPAFPALTFPSGSRSPATSAPQATISAVPDPAPQAPTASSSAQNPIPAFGASQRPTRTPRSTPKASRLSTSPLTRKKADGPVTRSRAATVQSDMDVEADQVRYPISHLRSPSAPVPGVIVTGPPLPVTNWDASSPSLLWILLMYLAAGPRIAVFALLLLLVCPVTATRDAHTLTSLTLNASSFSFRNLDKADALTRLVDSLRPDIIFLSEFGMLQKDIFPWCHPAYHIRAAVSGMSTSQSTAVLVHRDIPVLPDTDSPPPPANLTGRVARIDISLTVARRPCRVRVMCAYAPVSPNAALLRQFWSWVADNLGDAPNWLVGGDFNAHLTEDEISGYLSHDGDRQRSAQAYRTFLANTHSTDCWQAGRHGGLHQDWTYSHVTAPGAPRPLRIIDRVASSALLRPHTVRASTTTIPNTAHRAVVAKHAMLDLSVTRGYSSRVPPRYRKPAPRDAAPLGARFRSILDHGDTPPPTVTSTASQEQAIATLNHAVLSAAPRVYQRKPRGFVNPGLARRSETEDRLKRDLAATRRLSAAVRYRPESVARLSETDTGIQRQIAELPGRQPSPKAVARHRNGIVRALRRERWSPNFVPTTEDWVGWYKKALKGGRVKGLFNPPALTTAPVYQTPEGLVVSNPTDKLNTLRTHFETLLHRPPPPPTEDRPWLNSTFARDTREKLQRDPDLAVWPQPMTLPDLRSVLTSGNPNPSPGPDGIEKWMLRCASDDFLQRVLDICNYAIMHNSFPDPMKENYLSPLYKRGDPSLPSNYRGIVFANCIQSLTGAWFARCLQRMSWRLQLLPDTQIATQKGVRPADMTNFLAMVDRLARNNGDTLYAIKRDHTKGFDFMSPKGFEDAVRAYGLPEQLIHFERARTAHVSLTVRTQDGTADPIHTDGQMKQGDSASPIKYTLTMSMLHRWLKDSAPAPVLRTIKGAAQTPHLAVDREKLELQSVEAMDDSVLFGSSEPELAQVTNLAEQFQRAYNIETAWGDSSKTAVFLLGSKENSFSDANCISMTVLGVLRRIPVLPNAVLLRTAIDRPTVSRDRIADRIASMRMPPLPAAPPAIYYRALWSVLVPSIRPLLHAQPLYPKDARSLDRLVSDKWCDALGLPVTQSPILTLPLDRHGFGLPSIERLNAEMAVEAVLRLLNHPLKPMALAARMTLANWTCSPGYACKDPFSHLANSKYLDHSAQHKNSNALVPLTWVVARDAMHRAGLTVVATDQALQPQGPSVRHCLNAGDIDDDVRRRAGPLDLPLSDALDNAALASVDWPTVLSPWDKSLLISRAQRADLALTALTPIPGELPAPSGWTPPAATWASDGSFVRSPRPPQPASATGAVVGPSGLTVALRGVAEPHSGLGELLAASVGLLAAGQAGGSSTLLTDYAAVLRTTAQVRASATDSLLHLDWRNRRDLEYYNLLRSALQRAPETRVRHVKAHTDGDDEDSAMNDWADSNAKAAHEHPDLLLPPPTFAMRPYAVFKTAAGYANDTWRADLEEAQVRFAISRMTPQARLRLNNGRTNESMPVVAYWHTSSPATLLPKLHYLTRTGLLDTPSRRWQRGGYVNPACPLCGFADADEQHIFKNCPAVDVARTAVIEEATRLETDATPEIVAAWARAVRTTFHPPDTYGFAQFWHGYVPFPLPDPLTPGHARKLYSAALRVTAAIWGAWSAAALQAQPPPPPPPGSGGRGKSKPTGRRRLGGRTYTQRDPKSGPPGAPPATATAPARTRKRRRPRAPRPRNPPESHPPTPQNPSPPPPAPHPGPSPARSPPFTPPSPARTPHVSPAPGPPASPIRNASTTSLNQVSRTISGALSTHQPRKRARSATLLTGGEALPDDQSSLTSTHSPSPSPPPKRPRLPTPPLPIPFTREEARDYRSLPARLRTKHPHPRLLARLFRRSGPPLTPDEERHLRHAQRAYDEELRDRDEAQHAARQQQQQQLQRQAIPRPFTDAEADAYNALPAAERTRNPHPRLLARLFADDLEAHRDYLLAAQTAYTDELLALTLQAEQAPTPPPTTAPAPQHQPRPSGSAAQRPTAAVSVPVAQQPAMAGPSHSAGGAQQSGPSGAASSHKRRASTPPTTTPRPGKRRKKPP